MELTAAQRRELMRVRDTGHSKTRAGYKLRVEGLTEFVWKLRNGKEIVDSKVDQQGWYDQMQGAVCLGERITPVARPLFPSRMVSARANDGHRRTTA